MTAGLPGAGIGGLFYLASALFMPVRELAGFVRDPRAPRRWGIALRQATLAGGILAALWATGWLLALVLPETVRVAGGTLGAGAAGAAAGTVSRNVLKVSTIAFSLGTLALVLGIVQAARVLVRRRPKPDLPRPVRIPTPMAVRARRDAHAQRMPARWRSVDEPSGKARAYGS